MRRFNLDGFNLLAAVTLAYCIVGSLYLLAMNLNPLLLWLGIFRSLAIFVMLALDFAPVWVYVLIPIPILIFGTGRSITAHKIAKAVLAIVLCSTFTFMFSMIKFSMPDLVPFWADKMLAQLDLTTHLNNNPRDFLNFLSSFSPDSLTIVYHSGWVFLATFFPMLLIAFDPCETRTRQFILLWALCWVFLGNVMAIIFMSAGPIFAGLVPGVDPVYQASAQDLLNHDNAVILNFLREKLWVAYSSDSQVLGSGISAFPSVHVGMATVIGLYLMRLGADLGQSMQSELLKWAGYIAGTGIIVLYLILSVYLTWHYAVDGYVSLIVMFAFYTFLRRSSIFDKKAPIPTATDLHMPNA